MSNPMHTPAGEGPAETPDREAVGMVVIGRNEGERLRRCLKSIVGRVGRVVYADSDSQDHSVEVARELGAEVVRLDDSRPISAARARNEGFERLMQVAPQTRYVHFVDGDTVVLPGWIEWAVRTMMDDPELAALCGRRREIHPEATLWNRLTDLDWRVPPGEAAKMGGDAIIRAEVFRSAGGFNEDMLAEEDPELYFRVRIAGHKTLSVDRPMTLHDAAMTRFGQWWKRTVRVGHGFCEAFALHGLAHRYRMRELVSTLIWGGAVPLAIVLFAVAGLLHSVWWLMGIPVVLGGYLLIGWRIFRWRRWIGDTAREAMLYTGFALLAKFPSLLGVGLFCINRLRGRRGGYMQYKDVERPAQDADVAREPSASADNTEQPVRHA